MISYLFFVILPLIFVFAALVFQVIVSIFVLKGKLKLRLFWVNFMALMLGILLPAGVTMILIHGLPPGPQCITGLMSFVFGGVFITVITVPVIAIITWLIYRFKRKSVSIA